MASLSLEQMRHEAYQLFQLWADPCCLPSIAGEELGILNRHMRAMVWSPETRYLAGDEVQIHPRTGFRYRAIAAGVSGTFLPAPWGSSLRERLSEGSMVWEVVGADYDNVYDVRAAAHEAWSIKAGKASTLVTTSVGQSSIQASALHEQCRARAREFAPLP
jgi:hypothetical protein